jgi:glycosyltransferase involved in cell wall biosynthesis
MDSGAARRQVVMLARHFPPIGGAGVHRSVGYARHLGEYGYRPVVVTGPGPGADRWSPEDRGLLGQVPPDTEVHRLAGPEPAGHVGARARLDRWTQRPQPWVRWWVDGAVELGAAVGGGADLVLASCVPYETAWAGARLARRLGVPWVADLEDPWALDEMRVHPTALHRRRDLARMRSALAGAAAIVTCAPEAAERMRHALPNQAERIVSVPIGFDRESFEGVPAAPRTDGTFRIVHAGSLHTELGQAHRRGAGRRRLLGGAAQETDILTRSPVFLLEAIRDLVAADPRLGQRIELHLAGELTAGDRAVCAGHDFVREAGQLDHAETVALMRSADLLFLPMHDLPPGSRAGLIPYKTYEYLAAERPILAAVPDGDVRDLLEPLDHASVCRPADVDAMRHEIGRWLERAPVGRVAQGRDSEHLDALDRRVQVGRVAAFFDGFVGRRGG